MSGKLPYKIPRTWVWCSHNSILDISGGSDLRRVILKLYLNQITLDFIRLEIMESLLYPVYIPINLASKQTEKGDILLARYGGSLEKVVSC